MPVDWTRRAEPWMSAWQQAAEGFHLKFRMIWLGPVDEPTHPASVPEELVSGPQYCVPFYEQHGTSMVRCERLRNHNEKITPLANFSARIVQDLVFDDDVNQRRHFAIEANVANQKVFLLIPATEFTRMNWVLPNLGPQAIIYPGQQQHARAAIQSLSGSIQQEVIFANLGWKKHGQDWVYLQAGGAVGPSGTLADCQVRLPPPLQHYETRVPADPGELLKAVRSSLRLLSLAPDRISLPLLAAVYRAPLGRAGFSLFLTGRTGTFKTALAAVCQQHFGPAMDAGSLLANFASTSNALEEIAFSAKDSLLVVDDFAPTGGVGDNELHGIAERLFRASGNHQGRNRMSGQRQLQSSRPPRALLLATGEEVPRGHSLRARLLILDINPGDVDPGVLTESQRAGKEGAFATAMGGYLMWIAGRYDELQHRLRARVIKLRTGAYKHASSVHARLPTTLAELDSGLELWLQFGFEIGAITAVEKDQLQKRSEQAFDQIAGLQVAYHRSSDPALRFLSLLRMALAGGCAHIAARDGQAPDSPESWGWRKLKGRTWVAQGTRIGWVGGSDLFLEAEVSYGVARQIAGAEHLSLTAQTLRHRLREHGLLASVDAGRQMLLVRRTLEGAARQVLHLKVQDFRRQEAIIAL
jgi:hypothetical protein